MDSQFDSPNLGKLNRVQPIIMQRRALGWWAFALLFAWMLSLIVVKPVAAQSDVTPSAPCFASTNLTNLSGGGTRGITNQPVISSNGARVAFWSVNNLGGGNDDGNIEVFVRETGSNSIVQLTNSVGSILGGFNLQPSINANGTVIAFYSDRDLVDGQNTDGNFEIFMARRGKANAWSITQITHTDGSANLFPSIDAAGDKIAFVSDDSELHNIDQTHVNADRNFEIYLATIPATGAVKFRQITDTGSGVTNDQPVINAAGSRIAFTAATGQTSQVFVWDESHSTPAQLTQTDNNDQPSISADGTGIVYIATTADDRSRVVLHTLSADGSESHAEVIVPSATNTKYRSPSISGNGRRVVYVAEQSTGAAIQINVLLYDVISKLGVPISEVGGGTGEQPAISADGTRVTFVGVQAVGGSTDNIGSDIYINECPQSDLSIEFVNPPIQKVLAGIDIAYELRVTNHGPSVADNAFFKSDLGALPALPAKVSRILPPGCNIDSDSILLCPLGDIAVNASRVFTIGYDIPSDAALAEIVSDIEVGANSVDSSPRDNRTGQFKTRIFEESALSLAVTPDHNSILAGSPDQLTYDLVVSNAGPSQGRSARITDTLPLSSTFVSVQVIQGGGVSPTCNAAVGRVVTCQLGNLTAGSTTTVRIKVTAKASAPATWTNVATVRSLTEESNLVNNTVSTLTQVQRSADMAITKIASPANQVIAGTKITYTLTFTNKGFADTLNVTVIDTLPPNVTYVSSVVPSGASCAGNAAGASCSFPGPLLVGQSRSFKIVALVQSTAPAGPISNTARVISGRSDPNPLNDVTPAVHNTVTLLADLAISKTVSKALPDIFEPFTYTIKLRNDGPSQAYGVVVTDIAPSALMTFTSASATRGSFNIGTGLWTVGTLPVKALGQEDILTIHAVVGSAGGGATFINEATAGSTVAEPVLGLDSSASVTITAQRADIAVGITSSPITSTHVIAGKRLTYTLTLTNTGPTLARSVLLTNTLPNGVFLVDAPLVPGGHAACTTSPTVVKCNIGNMDVDEVLAYTVVVTRELKGFITNTVSISTKTPDLNLANNSALHSILVDPDKPHHLIFSQQPPAVLTAGDTFVPAPKVKILDQFNNLIVDTVGFSDNIRLEPYLNVGAPCTNLTDSTGLSGNNSIAGSGEATFASLVNIRSGIIRLRARDTSRGGVLTACSNVIGINPGNVKRLVFKTPPRTPIAGDVTLPLTVERQDQFTNTITNGDFTILLSHNSHGTGTFLDNNVNGVPITTSVIVSGSTQTTFFYTDTVIGNYTITATAPSVITPAVQSLVVLAAPAQELLVVITAPLTTTAGVSSGLFTVQRTDRFNNPNTTDPQVKVNLLTNSHTGHGIFRNIADTATVTQVVIPLGFSTTQFRYQDRIAATYTLSTTDAAGAPPTGLHGDSVPITVVPAITNKLIITSTPKTFLVGTVSSAISVARQDVFGNNNFNDSDLQVNLASSSKGLAKQFRLTANGGGVPSVTIPQGSDFVSFFYTDTLSGTFVITASATGKVSATQNITLTPDAPAQLAIISTFTQTIAGAPPITVTIQRQDQFGNPAPTGGSLVIQLTAPVGTFLPIGPGAAINHVTITNTDASFRYQVNQQGTFTLEYNEGPGSPFHASQEIIVAPNVATKLVFIQPPPGVTAGVTSSVFEVQRQDPFGNASPGPSPLQVNLTSSSSGHYKFTDGISSFAITDVVIPGNTASALFYYMDDRAAKVLITGDDIGSLTPATTTITITAAQPSKLVFINPVVSATAGVTSTSVFTVQVQDEFGNAVITPSLTVNLVTTADKPPARFVNAAGTAQLTSNSILISNSSTGRFRYYDEKAGFPGLTADDAATSLQAGQQSVTILADVANHLAFATLPLTVTAGVNSSPITLERRDKFNNPNTTDSARGVHLASNSTDTPQFFDAAGTALLPGNNITITNGSSTAVFRYKDTFRGAPIITASSIGFTPNITQQEHVIGATATRLKLFGPLQQTAGVTITYAITAFDSFNNQSDAYTGIKTLVFGGASASPSGRLPTVTNAAGAPIAFGSPTTVTFTSGVATSGGRITLYDVATPTITITDTGNNIFATGGDAFVAHVVVGPIFSVGAETTNGSSKIPSIIPTQTITAGSSVFLWAVKRDPFGNSLGNVAASWTFTPTGGMVLGDIGGPVSSSPFIIFTGHLSGTVIFVPHVAGINHIIQSGKITIRPNVDAVVRVETKADGTGGVVPTQNITAGQSVTVYAIVRDSFGNFKSNPPAAWEIITATAGVTTSVNLTPLVASSFTVFSAKLAGSGGIRATVVPNLSRVPSGLITVKSAPATHFVVGTFNGVTTFNVNSPQRFTVVARDGFNNIDTNYIGTHSLFFSGSNPGKAPIVTPYIPFVLNASSQQINFGAAVTLTFSSGTMTTGSNGPGTFRLFDSPYPTSTVVLMVSDNAITGTIAVTPTVVTGSQKKLAITAPVNSVAAGTGVSLTITAADNYGNRVPSFHSSQDLKFSGTPNPSITGHLPTVTRGNTGASIPFSTTTPINFDHGLSTVAGATNGVMRIYKSGVYTVEAEGTPGSTAKSGAFGLRITVTAALTQSLGMFLTSPQTNRVPFAGTNVITLTDTFGNAVAAHPVTVTTSLGGSVVISNSHADNVLAEAGENDFSSAGVANLSATGASHLDMRYQGPASASLAITATTDNPLGGFLTASRTIVMNSGAPTQLSILGATKASPSYASSVVITAGKPISLMVTLLDPDNNVAVTSSITPTLAFVSAPTTSGIITNVNNQPTTIGGATFIRFINGVSHVAANGANGALVVQPVGTFTLTATSSSPLLTTPSSKALHVTVVPGPLDHFALAMFGNAHTMSPGIVLSGTITGLDLYGQTINYTGDLNITFAGGAIANAPNGTKATVAQGAGDLNLIPGPNLLHFTAGVANINLKLYKAQTSSFSVSNGGSALSNAWAVTVTAGALNSFQVNIKATQPLTTPFSSPAVITATDSVLNVITNFSAVSTPVKVTFQSSPSCGALTPVPFGLGSPSGDTLNQAGDFLNGVANLVQAPNAMSVHTGCAGPYVFHFANGSVSGNSGTITLGP